MKHLVKLMVIGLVLGSCQEKFQDSEARSETNAIQLLDANNDGKINPYEALDVLLQMQKEHDGDISVEEFSTLVSTFRREEKEEMQEFFAEFDQNQDGQIQYEEAHDDIREFIVAMDANRDEQVTLAEMENFDFASVLLADEEEITQEVEGLFEDLAKGEETIDLSGMAGDEFERMVDLDRNKDGAITKEEALEFMLADNVPVQFEIKDTVALMKGVITAGLPAKVLQLLIEHPEVTTIEMLIAPGSIDDVANLRAALYVNKFGLTTKLNANSYVASGGTDFFLAGKKTMVEDGARLGVHSWGGGNIPATEVPKDDPEHQKYLDYYKAVGIPEAFYWYTLDAAPAGAMHHMTKEEIERYKIIKP